MVLDKNKVLSVIGLDPNVEVVLPPKLSAYKHSNYIEQGRAKMLNQFITLAQILFAAVISHAVDGVSAYRKDSGTLLYCYGEFGCLFHAVYPLGAARWLVACGF